MATVRVGSKQLLHPLAPLFVGCFELPHSSISSLPTFQVVSGLPVDVFSFGIVMAEVVLGGKKVVRVCVAVALFLLE